jgi:hypothetical protein
LPGKQILKDKEGHRTNKKYQHKKSVNKEIIIGKLDPNYELSLK